MTEDFGYLDSPNGIVLCIDRNGEGRTEGRLYHGYREQGIPFMGYEKIIRVAEELFNALGFPFMGTNDRDIYGNTHYYRKKERMTRILKDDELLRQHGHLGTFAIRVQHRQHSSWQGKVTYLEENRSVHFRSLLELIKIIDGALDDAERKTGAEYSDELE